MRNRWMRKGVIRLQLRGLEVPVLVIKLIEAVPLLVVISATLVWIMIRSSTQTLERHILEITIIVVSGVLPLLLEIFILSLRFIVLLLLMVIGLLVLHWGRHGRGRTHKRLHHLLLHHVMGRW